LTLGGLGIWSLIDLVRIILGNLKPKDGEYDITSASATPHSPEVISNNS
tara:strand:+ start:12309 stop:12455 length:147 start_codon:yes stop_codon:yes gene_type:complete